MSPSPLPTPSPSTGGAVWNPAASGTSPASGSIYNASGPWMIEQQTLNIDYIRVPKYGNATQSLDLSGPTRTISVLGTGLCQVITATYSKVKSYDQFDTSAYTQSQQFQYNAVSGDYLGNSYGSVGSTALGPNGSIVTKTPWYQRRYWEADIDTEDSQSAYGTTNWFSSVGNNHIVDGAMFLYSDMYKRVSPDSRVADTFMNDWDYQLGVDWLYYNLPGPYSTAQESAASIISYIEGMADKVENTSLYGIGPDFIINQWGWPTANQGCTGYRRYRHSY